MATNESFFRDDSDTVSLGLSLDLYFPIIYSEAINFDWHNGWKCWTLASKNVPEEESNTRLEKWSAS